MDVQQILTTLVIGLVLALVPVYFTHRMHEKRADKEAKERREQREEDRQEREQVRLEERSEREFDRLLQRGLGFAEAFIQSATKFQEQVETARFKPLQDSLILDSVQSLRAKRDLMAAYFPSLIIRHADIVFEAARSVTHNFKDGDGTYIQDTEELADSLDVFSEKLAMFTLALQAHLGFVIPADLSDEMKRKLWLEGDPAASAPE